MKLSIVSSDDIEIYHTSLQPFQKAVLDINDKAVSLSILDRFYEYQKESMARNTYQQFYHYPHLINNCQYYLFQTHSQNVIILSVPAQQATQIDDSKIQIFLRKIQTYLATLQINPFY